MAHQKEILINARTGKPVKYPNQKRYADRLSLARGVLRPSHPRFIGPRISVQLANLVKSRAYQARNRKISLRPGNATFIGPLIPLKERRRLHSKYWTENNRDHIRKVQAAYRVKRADRFKERKRAFYNRHKTNPDFKLRTALSGRIRDAISGRRPVRGESRTLALTGCAIPFLRSHLESMFEPGMSWANHGMYGWHIDHRIPCAFFDLTNPVEQKMCFNWRNLRPRWAKDNLSKNDRITMDAVDSIHSLCANIDKISPWFSDNGLNAADCLDLVGDQSPA